MHKEVIDQTIKTGIVGLGRSGWNIHVPLLKGRNDYKIVAVCDFNQNYIREAEKELFCQGYSDFSEFVNNDEVELVIIATPTKEHTWMSKAVCRAEKHLVIEKPIVLNIAEAKDIQKRFQIKNLIVSAFHNFRYTEEFILIQSLIKKGLIGKPFLIKRHVGYFNRRDDWQSCQEKGGGILNAATIHSVDQIIELIGEKPKEVFSDLRKLITKGDAPDHSKILFKFNSGIVADIEVSWAQAFVPYPWMIYGTSGVIYQEKSKLIVKFFKESEISISPKENRSYLSSENITWKYREFDVKGTDDGIAEQFYDSLYLAIRHQGQNPVSMQSAIRTMEVMGQLKDDS